MLNPYDELPYKSCSIEWTAPERLAVTARLHGGPRTKLDAYRVLELGCGNGANLLPLAYYRRQAEFVGVDGAQSQIEIAQANRAALGLTNLEFIQADFLSTAERIAGKFDYIIAHGIFSWVPQEVRDALLAIFATRLNPGGLLYVNYNTRPGWNIRGLVRDFLLAQTAGETHLGVRARLAQEVSAKIAAALQGMEHVYSQLLANEFRFVNEGDASWVGHEFLSPENHPYWRSEFMELARRYNLEYVADADFNHASGRIPADLAPRLDVEQITGRSLDDTIDLLCYRQLHSPIMTPAPFQRSPVSEAEFADLILASCLEPLPVTSELIHPVFKHPSGYEVEAKEECMRLALLRLQPLWPRGLRVREAFPNGDDMRDDLLLLQRHNLIDLRCIEPADFGVDGKALNDLEIDCRGFFTTPYHQACKVESSSESPS